jgi:multiple sugar transport system permease protein
MAVLIDSPPIEESRPAVHPWRLRRPAAKPFVGLTHSVPRPLLLISVFVLVLLVAYPLAYTVGLSVTKSTLARPFTAFLGEDNFVKAFKSGTFVDSLWRTTIFATLAAIFELVLGLVLALALWARGGRFGTAGVFLLLPLVTPPIMVAAAWQLLLAPAGGGLSSVWTQIGLDGLNVFATGTGAFLTLVFIETWQWTPFVTLLAYVALLAVDQEQIEAALLDGANAWQRFRAVVLPSILPVLLGVFLIRVLGGFKSLDTSFAITKGGPGEATTFTTLQIFKTALDGGFNTGLASAQTLIFGVVVGLVTLVIVVARRKVTEKI